MQLLACANASCSRARGMRQLQVCIAAHLLLEPLTLQHSSARDNMAASKAATSKSITRRHAHHMP
jgi:hypothetical protein